MDLQKWKKFMVTWSLWDLDSLKWLWAMGPKKNTTNHSFCSCSFENMGFCTPFLTHSRSGKGLWMLLVVYHRFQIKVPGASNIRFPEKLLAEKWLHA